MKRKKRRRTRIKIFRLILLVLFIAGIFALLSTAWNWAFGSKTRNQLVIVSKDKLKKADFSEGISLDGNEYYERYVFHLEEEASSVSINEYSTGFKVIIKGSALKNVKLKENAPYGYNGDVEILYANETLEVTIPTDYKDNYAYVHPLDNSEVYIMVAKSEKPYAHSVTLDPGHGGADAGANYGDLLEKEVNLKVAKYMEMDLIYNGCNIAFTREDDNVTGTDREQLRNATNIANNFGADIFVSLHVNSYDGPEEVMGVGTYYYNRGHEEQSEQREALATTIQKYIITSDGWKDNGIKSENFQVLRDTNMPSVLVELGYISNAEDRERLNNNTILYNAAQNINKGIMEYLNSR